MREEPAAAAHAAAASVVEGNEEDARTPLLRKANDREQEWRVGLLECHKYPSNFVMSLCCPCVRFAQTAVRSGVDHGRWGFWPWFLLYFSAFAIFCLPFVFPWCPGAWPIFSGNDYASSLALPWCGVWWLAFPAIFGIGAWKRRHIRLNYNIPVPTCCNFCGGLCHDFYVHATCEPCALAQEAVHVDLAERGEVVTSFFMEDRRPPPDVKQLV